MGLDSGDSNFYRYVANSPINKSDPSGLDSQARIVEKTDGLVPSLYVENAQNPALNGPIATRATFAGPDMYLAVVNGRSYCASFSKIVIAVRTDAVKSWRDWDSWFAANGTDCQPVAPKPPPPKPPKAKPAPPFGPGGGQCPLPKKPTHVEPEPGFRFKLPGIDNGCPLTSGGKDCETRALTKAERQEIDEALKRWNEAFEAVAGFVPGVGDLLDLYSAVEGKSFVTEEDVGYLERVCVALLAVVPLLSASTLRQLLRILEALYEKLKQAARCLGDSSSVQRLLKWLREKILEIKLLLTNADPHIPGTSSGFPAPGDPPGLPPRPRPFHPIPALTNVSTNFFPFGGKWKLFVKSAEGSIEAIISGTDLFIEFYQAGPPGQNYGTAMIKAAIDLAAANGKNVTCVTATLGGTNASAFCLREAIWDTPLGKSMLQLGFGTVSGDYPPDWVFRK